MIKQMKNVDALKGHNSPVNNVRLNPVWSSYTHTHTHTQQLQCLPGSLHCGGSLQLDNVQTHLYVFEQPLIFGVKREVCRENTI